MPLNAKNDVAERPTLDAREDPRANPIPGQELVYDSIQGVWSACARRRLRDEFDRVATFSLFIGYPRSGHSVVGAMLNAHPHAVISRELDAPRLILAGCNRDTLYSRILARAAWFNLRGNRSNYRYQVPNCWQGRFEMLRVVGDKGGGWAAQWLRKHPGFRQQIRDTVGLPVRFIHVVRNPYDNIAAISRWHRMPLNESIEFYFSHCETTGALADDAEVLTVRHEDLISAPQEKLAELCAFLGLEADAEYLEACSSIVFDRPTGTRSRVEWSAAQVCEVERRARRYAFLAGYQFDARTDSGGRAAARGAAPAARFPSLLERAGAWLNPRVRPS